MSKVGKLIRDKDDALTRLTTANEDLATERFEKQRAREELNRLIAEKQGTGVGARMSYSDMAKKMTELRNDVRILQAERKTVLAHNPSTSTFEYIGEPLVLRPEGELQSVEELLQAIKDWLARPTNDRLSVK